MMAISPWTVAKSTFFLHAAPGVYLGWGARCATAVERLPHQREVLLQHDPVLIRVFVELLVLCSPHKKGQYFKDGKALF